jgi:DNA-directed RNA polymerase specialized sigma24 family protein
LIFRMRAADPILSEFLAAEGDAKRHALDALLARAAPAIRASIRRKLPEADADDLVAETQLRLLDRLLHAADNPLEDFLAYAAVTAYRVSYSWLRDTKPNRTRLSNQVRYLVENDRRFAGRIVPGASLNPALLAALRPFSDRALPELIDRILKAAGPLSLDALTDAVAQLQGVRDAPHEQLDEKTASSVETDLVGSLDRRRRLHTLWEQVGRLPLPQRHALLLNLRDDDGQSAIEALPVCGIAGLREIAAVLEMPLPELADLWNRLPLDDHAIAARLGLTRQQVINLRKSGRERLFRKLGPTAVILALLWGLTSLIRNAGRL